MACRHPSSAYCFQKLAPQWETTWASSTTMERILGAIAGLHKTSLRNGLDRIILGEIRAICHSPLQIFCFAIVSLCLNEICKYLQLSLLKYNCHVCYSLLWMSIQTHFERSRPVHDVSPLLLIETHWLTCSSWSARRGEIIKVTIPFDLSISAWGPAAIVVFPDPVPTWMRTSLQSSWALIASSWNSWGECVHLNFSQIFLSSPSRSLSLNPVHPLPFVVPAKAFCFFWFLDLELRGRSGIRVEFKFCCEKKVGFPNPSRSWSSTAFLLDSKLYSHTSHYARPFHFSWTVH